MIHHGAFLLLNGVRLSDGVFYAAVLPVDPFAVEPAVAGLALTNVVFAFIVFASIAFALLAFARAPSGVSASGQPQPTVPPDGLDWQALVESHLEPILVTQHGVIQYINPSGARLLGHPAHALIGESVLTFVHPSAHSAIIGRMRQIGAHQPTRPFRHRIRTAQGAFRTVETLSIPIEYNGAPAAQTVMRDLTAQEEAQAALRHQVTLNTLIVDLTAQMIDAASNLTDAHIETALETLGPFVGADRSYIFQCDATTFSNTHEWCAPGIAPQKHTLQRLPKQQFPWLFAQLASQEAIHIPDVEAMPESAAWMQEVLRSQSIQSLVLVPFAQADVSGFVGFDAVRTQRAWPDATIMLLRVLGDTFANALVRQQTEQALREREAQYRTVVDNVRDIVFQTNPSGCWTFLNPAWEAITGHPVAETLGTPCRRYIVGGEDASMPGAPFGAGDASRCEVRLKTRTGQTRWMVLFAHAVSDANGVPSGTVGTLYDVTERKRMEERTREALQRERELNQLQTRVMSMISHEFQTPLATIRSSAEMLARYATAWPRSKRDAYFRRIERQVNRASRLLKDVLATSTFEAKHHTPTWTSVDGPGFFHTIVDEARSDFASGRTLRLTLRNVPRRLRVDEDLLYHILSNLLSNAVKYSTAPVDVAVRVSDGTLHLTVEDAGIGIPEADRSHLTRPFYRGGNVGTTDGSGLGMTVVQRAVDVYGGALSIRSSPDAGARFDVSLPLPAASSDA